MEVIPMLLRLLAKVAGRGRTGAWSHLGTQADALLQTDILPTLFLADMVVEDKPEEERCPERRPVKVEVLVPTT
ncbi:MAG TPA: hypothetical protein VFV62_11640, partial [Gaiellaceae bacterium]|nr:hypothetical protein [Gaiellaceae bacterium]